MEAAVEAAAPAHGAKRYAGAGWRVWLAKESAAGAPAPALSLHRAAPCSSARAGGRGLRVSSCCRAGCLLLCGVCTRPPRRRDRPMGSGVGHAPERRRGARSSGRTVPAPADVRSCAVRAIARSVESICGTTAYWWRGDWDRLGEGARASARGRPPLTWRRRLLVGCLLAVLWTCSCRLLYSCTAVQLYCTTHVTCTCTAVAGRGKNLHLQIYSRFISFVCRALDPDRPPQVRPMRLALCRTLARPPPACV